MIIKLLYRKNTIKNNQKQAENHFQGTTNNTKT